MGRLDKGVPSMAAPISPEQVARTTLEEAKRRFDEGSAIFVDVRSADAYLKGHIPGTLHIPVAGPSEAYYRLPRDRDYILY